MVANFYQDLAYGKRAEKIVLETLAALTDEFIFEDVSDDRSCWHKGDIRATSTLGGEPFYLEVKNDSRIADTRNVLCEDAVWYNDISEWVDGNMYSDYEYYCVVSEVERKIYIIQFSVLKSIYKTLGRFEVIPHKEQLSNCYLVPLSAIDSARGLIKVIEY